MKRLLIVLLLAACGSQPSTPLPAPTTPSPTVPESQPTTPVQAGPTAADAAEFVRRAEAELLQLAIASERASWVQSNFITHDTELLAASAREKLIGRTAELAKEAARFNGVQVSPQVRRKIDLLRVSQSLAAPNDPARTAELTRLVAGMESTYGSGKYCRPNGTCFDLEQLSDTLAESRNPARLQEAWTGWHSIARPMRDDYERFVELANEGARELGFADAGAMWRSGYDMPPDDFARELDRLWGQVKPLYDQLHCYVRAELGKKYGFDLVPQNGPIPAHLLGNMWSQEWNNIYDLVKPGTAAASYDLTRILEQRKTTPQQMVKYGEGFFTSLGFAPLPETFWERSLFTKPRDREVVCHASAWDLDWANDLRIKMCIQPNAEDFATIHHELGHNFYQRAYNQQSYLFANSANDGFHEAIGDAIALSVTPKYLKQLGFIKAEPPAAQDIDLLMRDALSKLAFLPFGLLVDQWRWQVFSGQITPANYNAAWWQLREKYQGVKPPVARTEADFDPGAKYHVAANVPYTRYFLAAVLQFQFHRALCQAAGETGPLNRCSIYNNKEAGRRLAAMLEMGQSRPWQDALEALTGQREMDATAIRDYFAPLSAWLEKQNAGRVCGW